MENILKTMFGVSVYCPTYQIYAYGKRQHAPLFPGYIFVQMDLQLLPLNRINTCPGVFCVVRFDGDPFPVPRYVLDEVVERLEHTNMLHQPFQPGDSVRLKYDSPLQDLEMIFIGPMASGQRVNVLLRFLGRLKKASIDISALEKISSHMVPEETVTAQNAGRKRLTRGKGRKIKHLE